MLRSLCLSDVLWCRVCAGHCATSEPSRSRPSSPSSSSRQSWAPARKTQRAASASSRLVVLEALVKKHSLPQFHTPTVRSLRKDQICVTGASAFPPTGGKSGGSRSLMMPLSYFPELQWLPYSPVIRRSGVLPSHARANGSLPIPCMSFLRHRCSVSLLNKPAAPFRRLGSISFSSPIEPN